MLAAIQARCMYGCLLVSLTAVGCPVGNRPADRRLACRGALFYGAEDVLRKFMQMEAGSAGASLPPGAPQGDSPLSTHPAAVNRLRRLSELVTRLP